MNIVASIFGVGAMVSLFLLYQQKRREGMLFCKLSADVFWIAHYFCLGARAGIIPNLTGIFREIVFVHRKTKKWAASFLWALFFICINFTLGVLSYNEWYDILPIAASCFVTVSLWIDNPNLTRLISVPVSAAFLIYDMFVASYVGIINESIAIVSIVIYFIKNNKEKKENE